MLSLPEQRRPPCPRLHERYESLVLMDAAAILREAYGWRLVQAVQTPDGGVEALYER